MRGLRKWKKLKFGVFMHWGAFSQRVPYDGQYPGASWKLDYFEVQYTIEIFCTTIQPPYSLHTVY